MVVTTPKPPTRKKEQRSIDLPVYLQRIVPLWGSPSWMEADRWRNFVRNQPVAMLCQEHLISRVLSLDWKIEPRDSSQRDELKDEIRYYTRFLENTGDYTYSEIVEWISQDLLTIPFGGAAEIGREDDDPYGRVLWIIPLDGGTLFPTLNEKYPVFQQVSGVEKRVYFPKHAISRVYLTPRPEIQREGWGMAPPEKVFLAIELLNRGDIYYAKLLMDTPEAGILDLGDMEKSSAQEWVKAWRDLLGGVDPFKIPVLYEHTIQAKFIPFSRSPAELMFDKAVFRASALVAAGYGITLNDIGLASVFSQGGETLAGTIRNERITRRSGFARIKEKLRTFFNNILPPELEFVFIDYDDELLVSTGRARLATITALNQAISAGMITPQEARLQLLADGLVTVSIPEKLPSEAAPSGDDKAPERPGMLGAPVSPSQGGYGEIRSRINDLVDLVTNPDDLTLRRLVGKALETVGDLSSLSEVSDELRDPISEGMVEEINTVFSGLKDVVREAAVELVDDAVSVCSRCLEKQVNRMYEDGEVDSKEIPAISDPANLFFDDLYVMLRGVSADGIDMLVDSVIDGIGDAVFVFDDVQLSREEVLELSVSNIKRRCYNNREILIRSIGEKIVSICEEKARCLLE